MGRLYVAQLEGVSVSDARTLVELTAPSDSILIILEAWITQDASETSTQEVAAILRKTAAGTGTSHTPRLLETGDAAFGGTCRINCTAEGTAGDILARQSFNILNGYFYAPIPEERIIVPPSGIIALKFAVTPATAITISAGIKFIEKG